MHSKSFLLPLSLLLVASVVAAQQKPFAIKGSIKGKANGYVFLSYNGMSYDSSIIENGQFLFKGTLEGPVQAMVMVDRNAQFFDKYTQIFITPNQMQLSLDYNNFSEGAVLKGSSVQKEADELKASKASIMQKIKPITEAYNQANKAYSDAMKAKKDEASLNELKDKATKIKDSMEPYFEQISKLDKAFMDNHPKSFVTAFILRYRIANMPLNEGDTRYNKLSADIKSTNLGKEIKKELDGLRMGSPGAKAYIFASKELRGEPLSLQDFKGKYVLVDFWASWCVPCRKGNPHLLSLYSKYKSKGFEIIGVSDDDGNSEAWQKAVEKDGIGVWKHILRGLKRVEGPAMFDRSEDISDRFGIHSLPTKILIDPNGTIIGRYGGGGENDEAMDKKFAELFGE